MPTSLNQGLFDTAITLHLDIERVAKGVQGDVVRILEQMQKELIAKIASGDYTAWSKSRISKLLSESDAVIRSYYDNVKGVSIDSTTSIAQVAASNTLTSLAVATAHQVEISSLPTIQYLETLAGDTLIQGATQKAWWDRQTLDTQFKFKSAMRQGLVANESPSKTVSRIKDVLNTSKFNAETLTRTSAQSVANKARDQMMKDNSDIISAQELVSALDRRTCPKCGAMDGKRWTLDGKPIGHSMAFILAPIHFVCRCCLIPVIKPFDQLGIDLNNIPDQSRASVDGQVTDKTFQEWLKRKDSTDKSYADTVLGKGRAELWRSGKITFDQLINGSKIMSLADLKAKYL